MVLNVIEAEGTSILQGLVLKREALLSLWNVRLVLHQLLKTCKGIGKYHTEGHHLFATHAFDINSDSVSKSTLQVVSKLLFDRRLLLW